MAKWKKRHVVVFALATVPPAFLLASYLLFKDPLDLSAYSDRISALIEKKTGQKVAFDSLVLKVRPHSLISIKGLRVSKDGFLVAEALALEIKFPLFAMLLGRISMDRVEGVGLRFYAKRDADGRVVLPFPISAGASGKRISIRHLSVRGAAARFTDEYAGRTFEATDMDIDAVMAKGSLDYSMRARLANGAGLYITGVLDKDFNPVGTGSLKGMDLSLLNPYIKTSGVGIKGRAAINCSYAIDKGVSLRGVVDLKGVELLYPQGFARAVATERATAPFTLAYGDKGLEFNVDKADLAVEGLALSGSFRYSKRPGKEKDSLELRLKTGPFTPEAIAGRAIKLLKSPPKGLSQFASRFKTVAGVVQIDELYAQGASSDMTRPGWFKAPGRLRVSLSAEGLGFRYKALRFSEIFANASLNGSQAIVTDFKGIYNDKAVVIEELSGALRDIYFRPGFDVSLKASFDASETLSLLNELSREFSVDATLPAWILKTRASGAVSLALQAAGRLSRLKEADFKATIGLRRVKVSHPDAPFSLEQVHGAAHMDKRRISFVNLHAEDAHGTGLNLNGYVEDYRAGHPYLNVIAQGELKRPSLDSLKEAGLIADKTLANASFGRDAVLFQSTVIGKTDDLKASAHLDFTLTNFKYKKVLNKPAGQLARLSIKLRISKAAAAVDSAILKIGQSEISGIAAYSIIDNDLRFSIDSKKSLIRDLTRLSPLFTPDLEANGVLTFSASGQIHKDNKTSLEARVVIKDGSFSTVLLARPVEEMNAVLSVKDNSADIDIIGFRSGRSRLRGRASVPDISGRTVAFDLNADPLYLDDLLKRPEQKNASGMDNVKKTLSELFGSDTDAAVAKEPSPPYTGRGSLFIKKGDIYGRAFEGLSAVAELTTEKIALSPVSFAKNNGKVLSQITYYRDGPLLFIADVNFMDVDLLPFLAENGAIEKIVSGRVNGRLSIGAKRGITPFSAGLNGTAHLDSRAGRLYKFVVLNKIFSIVNIISVTELFDEGMPYRFISGDFLLKDGIISTENMRLDANAMRMSAMGAIDLRQGSIDAIVGLHPFVTLDKIITSIPVAGWIIGGREKSTLSMYYELKGPVNNPETSPMPITGLGKGALGILQRFLETPVEIINPQK